jgi:hypothetical protein
LRPGRWWCVSSFLFTPDWVDSAEAEKVGSQVSASAPIASIARDECVRHYRTTLGALNSLVQRSLWYLSVQAAASPPRSRLRSAGRNEELSRRRSSASSGEPAPCLPDIARRTDLSLHDLLLSTSFLVWSVRQRGRSCRGRRDQPSHSVNVSHSSVAPSWSREITQEPSTWGSRTIVPLRVLTRRLVNPIGPRCSSHVAKIVLRRPLLTW